MTETEKQKECGIHLFVREDIPNINLKLHKFPLIQILILILILMILILILIFVEINLRKTKWLLFVTHHPPTQADEYFFDHGGKSLDN